MNPCWDGRSIFIERNGGSTFVGLRRNSLIVCFETIAHDFPESLKNY